MIKLVSLNMEGSLHFDRILPFLDAQNADVICLQEAPSNFIYPLSTRGYFTSFAPMLTDGHTAPNDTLGIILATKVPAQFTTTYYHSPLQTIAATDGRNAATKSYPLVTAAFDQDGISYTIGTTHGYNTKDGLASVDQSNVVDKLIAFTSTLPPHILCGDMNIPRGHNANYERFCAVYQDEVPHHYTSSLDRSLHRAGKRTDLNAPIFDIYMVDYIFSQPPYLVTDVQLHFGVSDHAAVTATISKSETTHG